MENGLVSRHAMKDGGQVTGILSSVHFPPARSEPVEGGA